MKVYALTGGIGAGKSTVAEMFRDLGAATVDADELAREAVSPGTKGLKAIVAAFGAAVLDDNGALNRKRLGEIVFNDSAARMQLEEIVHPAVQNLLQQKIKEHTDRGRTDPLIYEIPLLAETGRSAEFAGVIVVTAPVSVRVARLVEARGLTEAEAYARIASQVSEEERHALADWIINTDTVVTETREQVAETWKAILQAQ